MVSLCYWDLTWHPSNCLWQRGMHSWKISDWNLQSFIFSSADSTPWVEKLIISREAEMIWWRAPWLGSFLCSDWDNMKWDFLKNKISVKIGWVIVNNFVFIDSWGWSGWPGTWLCGIKFSASFTADAPVYPISTLTALSCNSYCN